jgi:hypothetical protein
LGPLGKQRKIGQILKDLAQTRLPQAAENNEDGRVAQLAEQLTLNQ